MLILSKPLEPLKVHTHATKVFHDLSNLGDLPTEHSSMSFWQFLCHAQSHHDAVGIENQRERRFFVEKCEPQRVSVEALGAFNINDGGKSNEMVCGERTCLTHETILGWPGARRKRARTT